MRDRLADLIIHARVSNYNNQRAMDKIKAGQLPGPEMSIAKLAMAEFNKKATDFCIDLLGADARPCARCRSWPAPASPVP